MVSQRKTRVCSMNARRHTVVSQYFRAAVINDANMVSSAVPSTRQWFFASVNVTGSIAGADEISSE
jgi:hypothetical protein